jgi:hypothetical protein
MRMILDHRPFLGCGPVAPLKLPVEGAWNRVEGRYIGSLGAVQMAVSGGEHGLQGRATIRFEGRGSDGVVRQLGTVIRPNPPNTHDGILAAVTLWPEMRAVIDHVDPDTSVTVYAELGRP